MTPYRVSFNRQAVEANNEANQRMPLWDEPAGAELRDQENGSQL